MELDPCQIKGEGLLRKGPVWLSSLYYYEKSLLRDCTLGSLDNE